MITKTLITCCLIFISTLTFGQNKDELLYQAVSKKDTAKVKFLLIQGANANFKKKTGDFETSLLILAVQGKNYTISKLLIDHKVDVNFKDWFKTTALMYAASFGDKPIVELLIANGADVNAKDEQGNSVLSAAKESKNEEVIKLIEGLVKQ